MHCQPSLGLGRAIALFAFEGTYRNGGGKSVNVGILGAITEWLNPDQLIQSGRQYCSVKEKEGGKIKRNLFAYLLRELETKKRWTNSHTLKL
ncbi:hypothetical protein FDUTEX481_07965 [Tolypothrix sp. PCC 7601]|nr:hypothetical protein FDUTEX481_07965 [Tolypothrix sp. PCC 7601]